jgi:hypothetical protein
MVSIVWVFSGPAPARLAGMDRLWWFSRCSLCFALAPLQAGVQVQIERVAPSDAGAGFRFPSVPRPARSDAASGATFRVVAGQSDGNGGGVTVLNDGRLPVNEDQPARNFFFAPQSAGGRILMDLGRPMDLGAIHSYSWHGGNRASQVYEVYGSSGADAAFDPVAASSPTNTAWTRIASVDTRSSQGEAGGQHGVRIHAGDGTLGSFRYLLFDCHRTTREDPFDQTFFSEIDVLDANAPDVAESDQVAEPKPIRQTFDAGEGRYRFTIDSTLAPDLTGWANTNLVPVVREWYPRIVGLLPSEGFIAPERVLIEFKEDMGEVPASAGGGRINCNIGWFRRNLRGEAVGSVVHEMVHVVQQYGRPLRGVAGRVRPPGWLVEGIPDYIRWFLYEPETRGAEITARNFERARHDGNYRISANFLNWVVEKHGREVVVKLNAAAREGRYRDELWRELTGKTVEELGEAWREANRVRLGL